MIPHPIQHVLDAIIKRGDYFTTYEMEHAERFPWLEPLPPFNASPDRMKICPICMRNQPIAEFLIESNLLRTALIHRGAFATDVADVSEFCRSCET